MGRKKGTAAKPKESLVKGKGQAKTRSRRKTPSPSPSGSDRGESDHAPGDAGDAGEPGHSQPPRQKRLRVAADLTEEEEEAMVEFLTEHEVLYNKKLQDYRDKNKKQALWDEIAATLGKDVKLLQTWYDSVRTRYGKILKDNKKSGSGLDHLIQRQQWIFTKFGFLHQFIAPCPRRSLGRLETKSAHAPTTVTGDGPDDDDDYHTSMVSSLGDGAAAASTTPVTTPTPSEPTPVLLDVRPRRDGGRKDRAHEEQTLSKLNESRAQSIKLQSEFLTLMKTHKEPTNERTTYGNWCKSVMIDLHYSLWRKFQQEQTQLILKYSELNDEAKRSSMPPPQQPRQAPIPQELHYPSTSTQQHPSQQWQPTPHHWAVEVDPARSVCHSQEDDWIARQVHPQYTTLQPVPTTTSSAITANGPATTLLAQLSGSLHTSDVNLSSPSLPFSTGEQQPGEQNVSDFFK